MLRIRVVTIVTGICLMLGTPGSADERFAGFPTLGKLNPGKKSTSVIASDPVEGLLRPKWTRAMADLGSTVNLYRYQGALYFSHRDLDGHRGQTEHSKNILTRYRSDDEGRTWQPAPPKSTLMGGKYIVVRGDKLWNYWFENGMTQVQTSDDNDNWSEPVPAYEKPYWLYGIHYDPVSEQFWCAAQSMASGQHPDGSWILRDVHLVQSRDGVNWNHVSTLPLANVNISEADLLFEQDRTMSVIVRRKWSGDHSTLAVASPPYTQWKLSTLNEVAEGHGFFAAGGQVFLGTRAYYRDEIPEVAANKSLRYATEDGVAYTVIHRFTPDRKLVARAVLDSMGDCSYPRLVETPTEILCAYYSEHEDNVCKPYLAAFDKAAFLAQPADASPAPADYPPVGETQPGRPTAEPLASDEVPAPFRPAWTRAMADAGDSVEFYRYGEALYFEHAGGADGETVRYISRDEARSWTAAPTTAKRLPEQFLLAGPDRLLRYGFDGVQSWVQESRDGAAWTDPVKAYEAPFRLYGVIYDPATKLYWCATNSKPGVGEQLLRLIKSKDGIHWELVANIVQWPGTLEAAMHIEPDQTAVVIIRSGDSTSHYAAWAPPPYTSWYLTQRIEIAEEHSFAGIGSRIFIGSRAVLKDDQSRPVLSAAGELQHFLAIYRQTKTREPVLWAALDSHGDCGGLKLVETPTEVLCAYWSRHEDGVIKPYLAGLDKTLLLRKR